MLSKITVIVVRIVQFPFMVLGAFAWLMSWAIEYVVEYVVEYLEE